MPIQGKLSVISYETGGKIEKNKSLLENIPKSQITAKLIHVSRFGTPILELGEGYPRVMIVAGIHGNELPPQIASVRLINELSNNKNEFGGSIYMIPFSIPYATMENSRRFKGFDMNRTASKGGFISNDIIRTIKMFGISAVADFHSTRPRSNPGVESVFCSKKPCYESFLIARHMTRETTSKLILYEEAGSLYKGAVEDECNLAEIPAVTCEVVSESGEVNVGSPERSLLQIKSYLKYFNII